MHQWRISSSKWAVSAVASLFVAAAVVLVPRVVMPVATAAPGAPMSWQNLTYAVVPGFGSLLLDLYVPPADEPPPVILWVHGGGWSGGDKEGGPALDLARQGYAVANIQYRLSTEAPFPAQIQDVKSAVRWLRANAATYGFDDGRIGAWGASAGGHLAALLGTTTDVQEFDGTVGDNLEYSSRVQAVVDWFGPTDFLQMDAEALQGATIQHNAVDSPESLLLGCAIQSCPDRAARASPLTYISADAPPFLIMHGDQDRVVPPHQSEMLADALREAGVEVKLHMVPGAGHGLLPDPSLEAEVKAFFDRHLRLPS